MPENINSNPSFKIATFNIQLGVKVTRGYWQYLLSSWKYFFGHTMDFQKINKYIEGEKIDIIAFTEVGERLKTGKDVLDDDLIAALSGFDENVQANYKLWKIFKFGNAISTRFKILHFKEHYLSDKNKGRLLCKAAMEVHGRQLTVINTHLSLIGKNGRYKQIECIIDFIKGINTPFVLAGDFNTQREDDLAPFSALGMEKISFKTYPSWRPNKNLDYIFISPGLKLINSYVSADLKISDHLPLVAELQFI